MRQHEARRAATLVSAGEYARIAALAMLPVLAFAVVVAVVLVRAEQSRILADLERRATAAAVDLDRMFGRQIAVMRTLAGSAALDAGDLAGFYEEARRALATEEGWFTLVLSEPATGQQILNLLRPLGAPLPRFADMESHERTVRTRAPVLVARPDARGPVSGRPVAGVLLPVVRGDEVRYVLTSGVAPEVFVRSLAGLELPPGWSGGVIDDGGTIVACAGCPPGTAGRPVQPEVVAHLADRRSGSGAVVAYDGAPSRFAAGRAPLTGWAVAIRLPETDLRRIWLAELWVVGVGGLASVSAGLAGIWWLTRGRRRVQARLEAEVRTRTAELSRALAERDLLLREVYHRVKNNLQIVDSLVSLARRSGGADPGAVFDDLRRRIHALGLVHEQLMQSPDLATLDMAGFVRSLCRNLAVSSGADRRGIRIDAAADPRELPIDTAVPLGLLLTELVTNAFKHAFPDGGGGRIAVSLGNDGSGRLRLVVADDGTPSDVVPGSGSTGVGSAIVTALAAQLGGEMTVTRDGGTRVEVSLPSPGPQPDPQPGVGSPVPA
jgi:two-component sensor histidine kinase